MKQKRVIIDGVTGQDGSWLAELLLDKGYYVVGIIRRKSVVEENGSRIAHLSGRPNFETRYGDLLDRSSLENIITDVKPDELYHLGAQSHVGISAKLPEFTIMTNGVGFLHILEIVKNLKLNTKILLAASSEQFGNCVDEDGYQRETTAMHPVSIYGVSKLLAWSLGQHFRKAYNQFICSTICFNHESSRRGGNFVTKKIVNGAVNIAAGLQNELRLGNLNAYRDWGHASDYVNAMYKVMQHNKPDDFVIATGETHSVREFLDIVFTKLNMDYHDYVTIDDKYKRVNELHHLKGDATKARTILGWKPTYSFNGLINEMLDGEISKIDPTITYNKSLKKGV